MGGTMSSSVVPCAIFCEKPKMKTRAGMMMMAPPMPKSPLIVPAANPRIP